MMDLEPHAYLLDAERRRRLPRAKPTCYYCGRRPDEHTDHEPPRLINGLYTLADHLPTEHLDHLTERDRDRAQEARAGAYDLLHVNQWVMASPDAATPQTPYVRETDARGADFQRRYRASAHAVDLCRPHWPIVRAAAID